MLTYHLIYFIIYILLVCGGFYVLLSSGFPDNYIHLELLRYW